MHGHLRHGTNILLVLPWLLHPKATDLQKTPTASQEEDLPGGGGATKGRDATNFGKYYSFSPITSGKAGNVKHCLQAWGAIMSDLSILAIIEFDVTLDFIGLPPENSPTVTVFPSVTLPGIAEELLNLGRNVVFIPTMWESGSFISPIFTTKKSDGSPRLILNLRKLNCYIRYVHFKMESLGDVLNIKPGVWMASVDLQDAYYTIPVYPDHQKYLIFSWQHKYYKFTCLPNGYAQAPMIFTKLLKHPFSFLSKRGHHSIIYIDDAYLQRVIHMMHATTMFMQQFLCFKNWGLPLTFESLCCIQLRKLNS